MIELDDITGSIVDVAMKIHIDLGPGLLESVYEVVLAKARKSAVLKLNDRKLSGLNTMVSCLRRGSVPTW